MKKVKVRYKGNYPIYFRCPGFKAKLQPGDMADIPEDIYEQELSQCIYWELIVKIKKQTLKEEDNNG